MDSWIRRPAIGKAHRLTLSLCLLLTGCAKAMRDDGHTKPLESSSFFTNQQSSRPTVPGTIARGHLKQSDGFHTGLAGGVFLAKLPVERDNATLLRGQQRYEIYCAPCHDSVGGGQGVIVQRGFKMPVPFSDEKLRAAPAGYFFDAISRGYKTMYPMAAQISVEDRWAIVAYVWALQRSQHASLSDVPDNERKNLEAQK